MTMTPRLTALLIATVAMLLVSQPLTADLVAHWKFDEDTGQVAEASTGPWNGTLTGDAAFVEGGVSGNAVHMTLAGNGYVDFGDILGAMDTDFSLSVWVKTPPGDTTSETIVVGKHVGKSSNGYFIGLNEFLGDYEPGTVWFHQSGGFVGERESISLVNDGNRHHIAISYDNGGFVKLYIDGVVEDNQSADSIRNSNGKFRVGGFIIDGQDRGTFTGYVDELRFYDNALSAQEVQALFEEGSQEDEFPINSGVNDAWYNPATNGQGFLISVFPEIEQMFVAWFTFDVERPPEDVTAMLGDPGHRWLTAQGAYSGSTANLTISVTEGGVFDSAEPPASNDGVGDGTMKIEFADCTEALVTYEIFSPAESGTIPIERITDDNVDLCETLSGQ